MDYKVLEFKGRTWRVAKSLAVWRKLVKEEAEEYLHFGYDRSNYTPHHIAGRDGLLKLIVENGCMVPNEIHGLQKAAKKEDRQKVDRYVIKVRGERLYNSLMDMRFYFRNVDPTGRLLKEQLGG